MKLVIAGIAGVNLALSAFLSFAYVAFTSNMVVSKVASLEVRPDDIYMEGGGLTGGIYRYLFCAFAALLLQGVLSILSLSILPYVSRDQAHTNRLSVVIGLCGFAVSLGTAAALIAFRL